MKMVLGVVRPEMAMKFGPKERGTEYLVGTILGMSTACCGTALCSPELVVGLEFIHV